MEYKNKTKAELITEVMRLRKQIARAGKNVAKPQKEDRTLVQKFHTLVASAHDAIFTVQGDCFIDCNTKTLEIFGLTSKKCIVGKPPYIFSPERQPDGRLSKEKAVSAIVAAQHGTPQFFEWKHKKLDGTLFDAEVSLTRLPPPNEPLVIAIVRDVTERKQAEEHLKQLHEQLTEEHRQRKLLSERLIQLLEKHNRKISMDLHDHIGQSLVTIKMDLDMIHDQAAKTDTTLTALVAKAQKKTVQTIEDIEKIAYGLRPSMIDNLGLVPSLRELFNEIKKRTPLEIHFFNRGIPKRFDAEKELAIFRVVQEALTNIIKHSQAKNCFVNLIARGNSIALSVEDDGVGFVEPKQTKKGAPHGKVPLGLVFMQERVMQLKGDFTVESRPGGGVNLLAEIPL